MGRASSLCRAALWLLLVTRVSAQGAGEPDGVSGDFGVDVSDVGDLPAVPGLSGVWENRSKLVLTVIEVTPLAFFGADRMYLGHWVAGGAKFLTAGGLGFWAIVDWVLVIVSDLLCEEVSSNPLLPAAFEPGSVEPAFWLALVDLCAVSAFLVVANHRHCRGKWATILYLACTGSVFSARASTRFTETQEYQRVGEGDPVECMS